MSEAKWKLVPVEPTQEMVDAACEDGVSVDGRPVWKHDAGTQAKWKWSAMLSVAPQPVQTAEDERAAFEAEMRCEETWGHKNLRRNKFGHYVNPWTCAMWDAWQARAALASKPVPAGDVESLVKDIHDAIAELAGVARYPDLTDAIDRLAALAAQPVREQWQPIETAPEGTMILCANMKAREARDWCFVAWIVGGNVCGHRMDMPTHWMPLPAAPGITKE